MDRKSLSKKLRFEVFKRDLFTCQYCGKKAPDVVLHVDHVIPVAEGGDNDATNLVTSCIDCNQGKGARTLDDQSTVMKQRRQIEMDAQRREQIEMMLQWRKALSEAGDAQVKAAAEYFEELTGYTLSETGIRKVKPLVRKYGLMEMFEVIDIAFEQYFRSGTDADVGRMVNKFGGIARVRELERTDPLYAPVVKIVNTVAKNLAGGHQKGIVVSAVRQALERGVHEADIWRAYSDAYDAREFISLVDAL